MTQLLNSRYVRHYSNTTHLTRLALFYLAVSPRIVQSFAHIASVHSMVEEGIVGHSAKVVPTIIAIRYALQASQRQ